MTIKEIKEIKKNILYLNDCRIEVEEQIEKLWKWFRLSLLIEFGLLIIIVILFIFNFLKGGF